MEPPASGAEAGTEGTGAVTGNAPGQEGGVDSGTPPKDDGGVPSGVEGRVFKTKKDYTDAVKADVDARLERERAKHQRELEEARRDVENKRLQDEKKWEDLANNRANELAALKPQAEKAQRLEEAFGTYLESAREGLPASIISLLNKMDPPDQLEWIAQNGAEYKETPSGDSGKAGEGSGDDSAGGSGGTGDQGSPIWAGIKARIEGRQYSSGADVSRTYPGGSSADQRGEDPRKVIDDFNDVIRRKVTRGREG
jgi:hypothetical protein